MMMNDSSVNHLPLFFPKYLEIFNSKLLEKGVDYLINQPIFKNNNFSNDPTSGQHFIEEIIRFRLQAYKFCLKENITAQEQNQLQKLGIWEGMIEEIRGKIGNSKDFKTSSQNAELIEKRRQSQITKTWLNQKIEELIEAENTTPKTRAKQLRSEDSELAKLQELKEIEIIKALLELRLEQARQNSDEGLMEAGPAMPSEEMQTPVQQRYLKNDGLASEIWESKAMENTFLKRDEEFETGAAMWVEKSGEELDCKTTNNEGNKRKELATSNQSQFKRPRTSTKSNSQNVSAKTPISATKLETNNKSASQS